MNKEFCLSSKEKSILIKLYPKKKKRDYYNSKDVKKFIKKLKEEQFLLLTEKGEYGVSIDRINQLAGEKLIK